MKLKVTVANATLAAALAALSVISVSFAQSKAAVRPDISELMTAREFTGAGLQKLTPSELEALNAWLAKYTGAVVQTALDATSPAARGGISTTADVIESQIDDDFEGWDGDTIFKLRNGQIWQQATYHYEYHYAYRPKVIIFPDAGGFKAQVDGTSDSVNVRRLK